MSDTPNMGEGTSSIFAGHGGTETNSINYGESPLFFANEIKKRLKVSPDPYVLMDIGTFKGELLGNIIELLPEYKFETIGVDINSEALDENNIVDSKILGDARNLPLEDRSVDIVVVRYVLQWNTMESQKDILQEIARVIRKFAIIECVGPDNLNAILWREHSDELLSGKKVEKMKRGDNYFASEQEIQDWLDKLGIKFEKLRSRNVPGLSNVYIERYLLDEVEAKMTREILSGTDYLNQSDWLILPNN